MKYLVYKNFIYLGWICELVKLYFKLNNLDILNSVILFFNFDVRIVFNYKLMKEIK